MKTGFVAIIGRPNVGKSTLLNNFINTKIAIVSDKPGTTRHQIKGIYNDSETQIIFVDTPGIHKPKHQLGTKINQTAYQSIDGVDLILFIVDASQGLGQGDLRIIEMFKKEKTPVILVLNKIDKIKKEKIIYQIEQYKDLFDFKEIIPFSALKEANKYLIDVIKKYLTDETIYYPENQVTDQSEKFLISEIVREKVLGLTEEEIPHAVTCLVESIEYRQKKLLITVLVIVDRDSLKRILIGKNAKMIKEIGTRARPEIEALVNKPVFLELYVKVVKKWRDQQHYLKEFGYE